MGIRKKTGRKVYKKVIHYKDTFMPRIQIAANLCYQNLLLKSTDTNLQQTPKFIVKKPKKRKKTKLKKEREILRKKKYRR